MQLFSYVVGLLTISYCAANGQLSVVGKGVTLKCAGTPIDTDIVKLYWRYANGTNVFSCEDTDCKENRTTHSLVEGNIENRFWSILTIPNVSLDDEHEYVFRMTALGDMVQECKHNLTITVPPIGLILFNEDVGKPLRINGSLTVAAGENVTIVCKTNTSVKPAVRLEWMTPEGLNTFVDSQTNDSDENDMRLFVPTRKLSFQPNYTSSNNVSVVCKVAANSSLDHIKTSVNIYDKGEITTIGEYLSTDLKGDPSLTASSDGDSKESESSYTTQSVGSIADGINLVPWNKIAGGSGVVFLLLALLLVGVIIYSKKKAVRRSVKAGSSSSATHSRPSLGRGALPPTPSDEPSFPANHVPALSSSSARSSTPVPSVPPDIPMRPLVPVSDDTVRNLSEQDNNRKKGATAQTARSCTSVIHVQKQIDTEMEYDVVNKRNRNEHGAVPHVYRETTNGLAEYALVSRPKVDKKKIKPQALHTKEIDNEMKYFVVNRSNPTERGPVPRVFAETGSGLVEYAVLNKPDDKNICLSDVRHTKVPYSLEEEYAVVDKSNKHEA